MTLFFERPEGAPPGSVLVDADGEVWVRSERAAMPRSPRPERAGPWHLVAGPGRLPGCPDLQAVLNTKTRIGALLAASPDLAFRVVRAGGRYHVHDTRVESIDGPFGLRALAA